MMDYDVYAVLDGVKKGIIEISFYPNNRVCYIIDGFYHLTPHKRQTYDEYLDGKYPIDIAWDIVDELDWVFDSTSESDKADAEDFVEALYSMLGIQS